VFARPILTEIRARVHASSSELDEAIKWGMPFFTYEGVLVCYMAAFTAHAAFGFYGGEAVLGKGVEKRDAMGSLGKLTSIKDLPSKAAVRTWIKRAVALAKDRAAGKRSARKPKPALRAPTDLAAALKADATMRTHWEAFTPGKRRDYIEWIVGAKQPATRARRLATTIAWVREGKSQNWRYEAKR
jgi:uncharacterized protein YdeI (YjbR/CyaY-like superfamily)